MSYNFPTADEIHRMIASRPPVATGDAREGWRYSDFHGEEDHHPDCLPAWAYYLLRRLPGAVRCYGAVAFPVRKGEFAPHPAFQAVHAALQAGERHLKVEWEAYYDHGCRGPGCGTRTHREFALIPATPGRHFVAVWDETAGRCSTSHRYYDVTPGDSPGEWIVRQYTHEVWFRNPETDEAELLAEETIGEPVTVREVTEGDAMKTFEVVARVRRAGAIGAFSNARFEVTAADASGACEAAMNAAQSSGMEWAGTVSVREITGGEG